MQQKLTDCKVTAPKSSDTHEEDIAGWSEMYFLRGPLLWTAILHVTIQALTDAGLDYADVYVLAGLHIISGHDDEFREMREARRKCQKFWDVIAGKYKAKALMHHNGPVELFLRRR